MPRIGDWLDERTGYRSALKVMLEEPVPGGASFAYVFGSVLTYILVQQMVTGVILALYYSPSAQTAWASVAYLQDQVTMGWFIRGLHAHGASAMVIVAGLHLLQTAVYGAYKKPREVNWLAGGLMLAVILAFALTGYLLPWDQKGYWATKVATGIMGETPLIGSWLQSLVQGGNEYGNLTLTRFFAIHVFILPAAILGLLGLHLVLFRKHGVTPRWGRSADVLAGRTQPFWPDQMMRDMLAIAAAFAILVYLVAQKHGVELGAPADPASGFDARPEWYFRPLFQMLKYFHGVLEPVAALGAPAVIGFIIFAIPFIDRREDRSPMKRLAYLTPIFAIFAGAGLLMALSYQSDAANPGFQERQAKAAEQADRARHLALEGVPPAGGTAVYENDPNFQAMRTFGERCASCHVGGAKQRKAPELAAGYNSRAWIHDYLAAPDDARFFGATKDIHKMKPAKLEGADLDAVVEMIYAETGATDAHADLVMKANPLFDNASCTDCHSRDGTTTGDEGPNLGGRGSKAWLAAFIADPGDPRFFGGLNEMPVFKGKLTPAEIDVLAGYVSSLAAGK